MIQPDKEPAEAAVAAEVQKRNAAVRRAAAVAADAAVARLRGNAVVAAGTGGHPALTATERGIVTENHTGDEELADMESKLSIHSNFTPYRISDKAFVLIVSFYQLAPCDFIRQRLK